MMQTVFGHPPIDKVDEETTKQVCLEKTLIFEQESASPLAGAHGLPPSWAWAGTQSENVKENLVNVIFGQSIKSDLAQITFQKSGVMSVGAIKTRLTDLLMMRKERIAIFAAWDQTVILEEWQMAPHNILVEDTLTMLTPSYDYVNVGNPRTKAKFIIKIKPTTSNQDILATISRITNLPMDEFMLVDYKGKMWVYPYSRPTRSAVIITRPIPRGGMDRERSRSRDSPTACDLTPTRPLSPTLPFLESSNSTPERLTPAERIAPERQEPEVEPDSVLGRREDYERRSSLRPLPFVNLPHEEPRRRALQAAGLEFEDGDPAIRAPPLRVPVRDNIVDPLPASSIVLSSAWPESPPPAQPTRVERSIICDNVPVGSVYAAADSRCVDHHRSLSPLRVSMS